MNWVIFVSLAVKFFKSENQLLSCKVFNILGGILYFYVEGLMSLPMCVKCPSYILVIVSVGFKDTLKSLY